MTHSDDQSPQHTEAFLTPIEARIIGCLMEKQRTTPDQYPLTLNSLVSACNQKSARHPVMALSPGAVGHAVNQLRDRGLVHVGFNGRTERYDHKMVGSFFLSREEQAILCALLLRGPQTAGEIRTNTGRMADFSSLDTVTKTLHEMATREHALTVELPRLPGRREERWTHLLCGRPSEEAVPTAMTSAPERAGGSDRIQALELEVAELREDLDRLWALTGLADQR